MKLRILLGLAFSVGFCRCSFAVSTSEISLHHILSLNVLYLIPAMGMYFLGVWLRPSDGGGFWSP